MASSELHCGPSELCRGELPPVTAISMTWAMSAGERPNTDLVGTRNRRTSRLGPVQRRRQRAVWNTVVGPGPKRRPVRVGDVVVGERSFV